MNTSGTASGGGWSRRDFLAGLGLSVATAAGAAGAAAGESPRTESAPDRPRNVIFMVSDGMSAGVLSLADQYARLTGRHGAVWSELLANPQAVLGWSETSSLSSPVTDSAAASSAWGSGSRVRNGQINMLPDGTRLTPIAKLVRDSGRRVGLVTTATVTHATPAGFAAVNDNRQLENVIAPQYLDLVDVILGGGRKFFSPDLLREYESADYRVMSTAKDLVAADGKPRLLGLFDEGHLPYSIDRGELPGPAAPTLAQMTHVALSSLSRHERGFLLQVEGARIDHAAHANDAPALLGDQLAFDDAIAVALRFAERRGDTLVVVTTDHGNANPGLLGLGDGYRGSGDLFGNVARMKGSYDQLLRRLGREADLTEAQVRIAAAELLGVELSAEHVGVVAELVRHRAVASPLHAQGRSVHYALGQIMSHYTGVGWIGISHTSDHAVVTAIGPGARRFAGIHPLTAAFVAMTELLDCPHRNPSMTPEQARRFSARPQPSRQAAWDEIHA